MKKLVPMGLALMLAACQGDSGTSDYPSDTPTAAERAECEASGGYIGSGGLYPWACRRDLPDAGAACTRATDCEGLCLFDPDTGRGSCAPVSPMFGCLSLLDDTGERLEICID